MHSLILDLALPCYFIFTLLLVYFMYFKEVCLWILCSCHFTSFMLYIVFNPVWLSQKYFSTAWTIMYKEIFILIPVQVKLLFLVSVLLHYYMYFLFLWYFYNIQYVEITGELFHTITRTHSNYSSLHVDETCQWKLYKAGSSCITWSKYYISEAQVSQTNTIINK